MLGLVDAACDRGGFASGLLGMAGGGAPQHCGRGAGDAHKVLRLDAGLFWPRGAKISIRSGRRPLAGRGGVPGGSLPDWWATSRPTDPPPVTPHHARRDGLRGLS